MIRVCLVLAFLSLLACKHSGIGNDIACQNPPPVVSLRVAKVTGSDTTAATNVAIFYLSETGKKTYIADLRNRDGAVSTSELINTSYLNKDPNFTLEVDNIQVASIQLKTYKENKACDDWAHQSELKLNNKTLVANARGVYFVNL